MTTTREVTLAFFHGEPIGILVEEDEYIALGGQALANAFDGHHVQLTRQQNGRYGIVDDINSDAFAFVNGVCIDEHPTTRGHVGARWKLGAEQSADVKTELEELVT